ncbi:hypothetical protein J5N97_001523 [Dioscorea zingiberensis]|uniref:Uncharacterized protein n=1 Tax=Dioscorea zingiberensis TaxID=325984 RepID=A0A9D5BTT6_9LILI|nr:hypothetical protein J5N97_001523 [Dioscorea zingiberensis]
MSAADLQKAVEKEFEMALQDRVLEETKDKKNAVDSYVYDMRNKLHESIRSSYQDQRRKHLLLSCKRLRIGCMEMQGDPIDERYKENIERGPANDQLLGSFMLIRFLKRSPEIVEHGGKK